MSKNPIPQDQRLYSGSSAQGSASLTTSSPIHPHQQQLALSGDIEASAASSTVGPHILTDPNPQGDKVTPPPAAFAHLSPSAARQRISIGDLMGIPTVVNPQQQQVAHPPAAMASMEEEGGLEGDDERGQPSGTVATEEEGTGASCTSISTRHSLNPAAQLPGAASSTIHPAASTLQQTEQASSQAAPQGASQVQLLNTTSPHKFRISPRTIRGSFIVRFATALQMLIQDVQHGGHTFSFGGLHPSTLVQTMETNAPWSAPPFLTLFKHLLQHLKASNPQHSQLKKWYISFARMLFTMKSASRPSETGAADKTLRDEIVDLWIRAWDEQPKADRGRAKVKREDLGSYY